MTQRAAGVVDARVDDVLRAYGGPGASKPQDLHAALRGIPKGVERISVDELFGRAPLARVDATPASVNAEPRPVNKRRGVPNKTEGLRLRELEVLKAAGEILDFGFERLKLRLADGAWFTPDLDVVFPDLHVEIEEIKGHWREAAMVRIKVAAEQFPCFKFTALRRVKGAWERQHFGRSA